MIWQSAGKSWEYLVGVYLGDGCVTTGPRGRTWFRLNTIDRDFAEATKIALQQHTDRAVTICTHPVKKSSKPNHSLSCSDLEICRRLVKETNGKQKLPDWIWTADHDGLLAFIAGLMDSEGYVAGRSPSDPYYNPGMVMMGFKSTDVWVMDFVKVLNKAGIEVGKVTVEKPQFEGRRVPIRFAIKIATWWRVGAYFCIARKQGKLARYVQLASEANTRNTAHKAVMIESDLLREQQRLAREGRSANG